MDLNAFFNGPGAVNESYKIFGLAHILWLAIPTVLIILMCIIFRKHKKTGKVFLIVFATVMLVLRITKYAVFRPIVWELGWMSAIPFELCTILSYTMPFIVIFNIRKLAEFVYPLAIIGGVVTMAYSEWIFNGTGLNFNKLESLIVHLLLIAIPLISTSVGKFEFKIKDFYKPMLAICLLVAYAHVANNYITPGANHMFLVNNPVPFDFWGLNHVVVFSIILVLVLYIMYLPSLFKRKQKT